MADADRKSVQVTKPSRQSRRSVTPPMPGKKQNDDSIISYSYLSSSLRILGQIIFHKLIHSAEHLILNMPDIVICDKCDPAEQGPAAAIQGIEQNVSNF